MAAIQGKKQSEAANILINFVQTAFDYKTDGDQFGYEKPFFVDELFYYPYSDCFFPCMAACNDGSTVCCTS